MEGNRILRDQALRGGGAVGLPPPFYMQRKSELALIRDECGLGISKTAFLIFHLFSSISSFNLGQWDHEILAKRLQKGGLCKLEKDTVAHQQCTKSSR